MSSEKRPEFFVDRSLGRTLPSRLRDDGHIVHLIADFYANDANDVDDETWIAEGCSRGWILLTKDKRIRYRPSELSALNGRMFCLSAGRANLEVIIHSFVSAMPSILSAAAREPVGYWHVYQDGSIKKMWP